MVVTVMPVSVPMRVLQALSVMAAAVLHLPEEAEAEAVYYLRVEIVMAWVAPSHQQV